MREISFNEIEGFKLGHAKNEKAVTGCTVVISKEGATAGVDVRGGAPGTRETDLLDPVNLVDVVHGVFISGGSAFGLDVATGIMEYLEEKDIGFKAGLTKIPIVTGAVLYDLSIGDSKVRPDRKMGYEACVNSENKVESYGNVGAGLGATVGKYSGAEFSMKGGLATYAVQVRDLKVGAVVAVNCMGDVVDPKNGAIIAGTLNDSKDGFVNSEELLIGGYGEIENPFIMNTTIGIVVTNAKFTKAQAKKIASMAQDGYARTMRPSHTMFDGDTIFALGTGEIEVDVNLVGLLAARVVEEAVLRGVKDAEPIEGYKAYKDF
ncbi:P1 family peptidase [Clostridium estertheticum]|uniref:P1 family peptidase n=1 Tax=Clostridium estertheticum TaxID=238834 RepID=UPI0013E98537|nr:P1 family peptidase [Clostridium estertheticum]MBZ9685945.1 P1 family peptidase [Clostridium estertheticum]